MLKDGHQLRAFFDHVAKSEFVIAFFASPLVLHRGDGHARDRDRDCDHVRAHVCALPPRPDECVHNQQYRATCSYALVVRESECQ